jgi:tRNA (guanine-N1)-methyltransferase
MVVRIDVITIFPEYFAPLNVSLIGKAVQRGDIVVELHNLRTWTHDLHRTVDDSPFGGGPGMVMKPEPWGEALDAVVTAARQRGTASPGATLGPEPAAQEPVARDLAAPYSPAPQPVARDLAAPYSPAPQPVARDLAAPYSPAPQPVARDLAAPYSPAPQPVAASGAVPGSRPGGGPQLIVPTPAGALFTQAMAGQLAQAEHLVFACGRYEGIDDRVVEYARQRMPVHELSIGDYVLAGGEPAVLVMIEAICRLLPGVLGNEDSAPDDSFGAGVGPMCGLVEGPAYTRPRAWRGLEVPPVLLSGDHAAIARWRRDRALRRTAINRPDLAAALRAEAMDERDRRSLSEAGFAVSADDVAH